MKLIVFGFALLLSVAVVLTASAQTRTDSTAITAAALDYAEGWYESSAERMTRALHPELEKRAMFPIKGQSGRTRLDQMSALTLIQYTAAGGGVHIPADRQLKEVSILDIYGDIASVKVVMSDWVDYLHVAKWEGEWKIVNVLWELSPEMKAKYR